LNFDTKSLTEQTHGLESLLVVGTSTTNEDTDLVLLELELVLLEGGDDSLEGRSDVGEVGDTSTDDEELSLGVGSSTGHEVDYGWEESAREGDGDEEDVRMVLAYSNVCPWVGAPEYSP
jgi:hypothetical protein